MSNATEAGLTPLEQTRRRRAVRILDAAADLLLRRGYQHVTIEDIAQQAEIGKGTIYLQWKTKEALFAALMQREAVAMWRALLQRTRARPEEVLFHRTLRSMLEIQAGAPIARAMFTEDRDLLGKLLRSGATAQLRAQQQDFQRQMLIWMREQGLLRTDLDLDAQGHAIRATVKGFLLAESQLGAFKPPLHVRADALAYTIRRAFEPDELPTGAALAASAARMIEIMERLCVAFERAIYGPADGDAASSGRG
ncbi:TetR/AcrR family transcriptional regulator [Nannocystis pusilla]|uniref:TetR/AcrR family transcriptional regulator n=1 Tax=Nannocystis pusilla TaxID=889268 RepID=A0ABS7TI48_9BACT|nr:TetR/AcrR family transcriptional regulator [Nannocystis pusilla]MBZ5707899.1 TetR/AcrR family transcriptional regulator [Nannocystis pusilla]